MVLHTGRSRALVTIVAALALLLTIVRPASAAGVANLATLRNNTGIAQTPADNANFDGVGYSYSSVALQLAGVAAGGTVTADGFSYTWPSVSAGANDNVVARGQVLPVALAAGKTKIGFLAVADHGPSTGKFLLNYEYTDATGALATKTVEQSLTFSDWTLNGGTGAPSRGNVQAIETTTRLLMSAAPDTVKAYVYSVSMTVDPTMTLKSIKLPAAYAGAIHIFDISAK